MDITKWLEGTAPAVRPTNPKQVHASPKTFGSLIGATLASRPSKSKARRRRETAPDSSILAPEHTQPDVLSPKTISKIQGVRGRSQSSEDATRFLSSGNRRTASANEMETYRRRKRRKTRLDRYDVKSKQPRLKNSKTNGEKKKQKKTSRKERQQRGKDKTVAPVVRNFQADNVQIERLTLPASNLGTFKRGRASSPFRARGLPDLAFTEMNFLRNRKRPQDATTPIDDAKAKRKKDRAKEVEEEISAYFAPMRPPLSERDHNVHMKHHGQPQSRSKRPRTNDLHEEASAPVFTFPSVEPQAQPQVASEVGRSESASASYFTWSESVVRSQGRDKAPSRSQIHVDDSAGQVLQGSQRARIKHHDLANSVFIHGMRQSDRSTGEDIAHVRPIGLESERSRNHHCGTVWKTSGNGRKVAQQVYQRELSLRAQRESLPVRDSTNLPDSLPLPSSLPLAIPKQSSITKEASISAELVTLQPSPTRRSRRMLETKEPRSSSSLGRLLNDCTAAFTEPCKSANEIRINLQADTPNIGSNSMNHTLGSLRVVKDRSSEDFTRGSRILEDDPSYYRTLRVEEVLANAELEEFGFDGPNEDQLEQAQFQMSTSAGGEVTSDSDGANNSTADGDVMEESVQRNEYVEDEQDGDIFAGFWKPNILY